MAGAESTAEIARMQEELDADVMRTQFNKVRLNDDDAPEDFGAALANLEAAGIKVDSTTDVVVDEFPEIDKAALVGRECIFLTWQLSRPESESFGQPFVVVRGITRDGQRFRFSDGSTGLFKQLVKITEKRIETNSRTPNAGLHVVYGLTASNYKVPHPDEKKASQGVTIDATTYYLATAPATK